MTIRLTGTIPGETELKSTEDENGEHTLHVISEGESGGTPVEVVGPTMSDVLAKTGQITVAVAGTAVQGGNIPLTNGVFVKALGGNTGKVYVGNDGWGDVSSTTGYELAAGEVAIFQVANLNQLWFDSATNGDKFCWMKG